MFISGTINFFFVLIAGISDYDEKQKLYISLTIGLGWVWYWIIKPMYKLVMFIKRKKEKKE